MFWSDVVLAACLLMFSGAASQGCDDTFTSRSGRVRSPGYSQAYPPNLDCTYLIQQTAGFVVRLQFQRYYFRLDKDGDTCRDYIQIYDGHNESAPVLGGPYCGDKRPPVLFSTQNVVMIRFHSDSTTTEGRQGFEINYSAIQADCDKTFTSTKGSVRSPGYSDPYPENWDCTYFIRQHAGYVIRLEFEHYWFHLDTDENGQCVDSLQIYDGPNESAPMLGGPYCGDTRPSVLFSTQNVVMIRFHSDSKTSYGRQGFEIDYAAIATDCDQTFTGSSGSVRSPGYSGPYPENWDCTYFIRQQDGYVIRLQFEHYWFHLDADNGQCVDTLQIYDGPNESAPMLGGPYCGSTRPSVLFSTKNVVMIRFHSDSKTSYGRQGFEIDYAAIDTDCDKTFTATKGSITPPGYSGPYPENWDCTYFIRQQDGYVIRLEFERYWFHLDAEDGECVDTLQVYDGDSESAPMLGGPYCGSTRPPVLFSTQNVVMVRFRSDNQTSYGRQGFQINYAAIATDCDKTFTNSKGSITSPGYSGPYPENWDCTYFIRQHAGYVIRLEFERYWFHLDADNGQCVDTLQVYDGASESAPMLGGPYCGDTRPPVLFSTQNVVMVRFHSDNQTSYGRQGFQINYARFGEAPDQEASCTCG